MEYNLKLVDYANDLQVCVYGKNYKRKESRSEDNKSVVDDNKQYTKDFWSNTWHNPKSNKIEIVPYGFKVIDVPFGVGKMLFPIDRFLDDTSDMWYSLEFEDLKKIVDEKIMEEEISKSYKNAFDSLRRTKQTIYKLARGNVWDLFVTITLADSDIRFDLDKAKEIVKKKINSLKTHGCNFGYLLIPEQHESGAWHFHGLIKNYKGLTLKRAINPHNGNYIRHNGMLVYNIIEFESLGYNTVSFVQDNSKVTKYITKYITKDMELKYPHKKKYLNSKGLNRGNEKYFLIQDEKEIEQILEGSYGYVPVLTHGKQVFNYYHNCYSKYMEYKK